MKKPSILKPRLSEQLDRLRLTVDDVHDGDKHSDLCVEEARLAGLTAEGLTMEGSVVHGVDLQGVRCPKLELTSVVLKGCNLSNSIANESIVHRVELWDCRLTGVDVPGSSVTHTFVKDSSLELGNFRFCSFKNVLFDNCMMREADFHGADLRGVRFKNCDLRKAEMGSAKLQGADLRGSQLDNLGFTLNSLYGVTIDSTQLLVLGWNLAATLGIIVQDNTPED